jgi:hypothetical protein
MYYHYILFPKLKADEHYIAPTRWQDFTFLAVLWVVILTVAFVAFRLIRFAVKPNARSTPAMRRPIRVQSFFTLSKRFVLFLFSQAASVATLPSAGERFSLGASWVFSIQQVLLSD